MILFVDSVLDPGTWSTLCSIEDNGVKPLIMKVYKTAKSDRASVGTPGTLVVEKTRLYVNTSDNLLERSRYSVDW